MMVDPQPHSVNAPPAERVRTSSWTLLIWPAAVLGFALLGSWWTGRLAEVGKPGYSRAQIVSIAQDQSSVRLRKTAHQNPSAAGSYSTEGLTVPASPPDLRAALKAELYVGDLVEYQESKKILRAIEVDVEGVTPEICWLTLLVAAGLLSLFCYLVLGGGPQALILGADRRYSKSKFQLVVWFGVAAVCYMSILWLRFCYSSNFLLGAVAIPTNLLALSGLSVLTFGGAKAITQSKQNQLAAGAAANPGRVARLGKSANLGSTSLIFDLVHDDAGNADLGDFQMVLVTLLAAVTYFVQFVSYLSFLPLHASVTMPDVDGTMLAIFGLGHGAYLTKKMASGPGPAGTPGTAGTSGTPGAIAAASGSGGSDAATVAGEVGPLPPGAVVANPDPTRRIGNEA